MENTFFLKLRNNIKLDGDVSLAKRELDVFFESVIPVSSSAEIIPFIDLPDDIISSFCRLSAPIGYLCKGEKSTLDRIVKRINFVQEIWLYQNNKKLLSGLNEKWIEKRKHNHGYAICILPLMAAAEILSFSKNIDMNDDPIKKIVKCLCQGDLKGHSNILNSIKRVSTSTLHVHGLHKYKAKFFPRMIRSFLVSVEDQLPRVNNKIIVLDPFVGSGTTLVEAALLGMDSIGIDIDKLSCEISVSKLKFLSLIPNELAQDVTTQLETFEDSLFSKIPKLNNYIFPPWIVQKFVRWDSIDEQEQYESEINYLLDGIDNNSEFYQLYMMAVSDALSRKFNIRMMGTGVGRFALEIGKKRLLTNFKINLKNLSHISHVVSTLIKQYDLSVAKSEVMSGNAVDMSIQDNSISAILTSPPYLPASSGRENYLIGKSISITALGIMDSNEIEECEKLSVGSMKNNGSNPFSDLPSEVETLYNWLDNDPLRNIKAKPSLAYYIDLKNALKESYRVLMKDGIAMYVIGKESVFYTFKTREILFKVNCAGIFHEIAESVGFEIVDRVDVELDKKNKNARPRSLDSFYETVFILRKL